jgi:hypothetical protein
MPEQPAEPTWWDWYQLKLWLWAFLVDAQAFLDASQKRHAISISPPTVPPRPWAERLEASAHYDLSKYHFVMTMGTLVKTLTRVVPLFAAIQGRAPKGRVSECQSFDL